MEILSIILVLHPNAVLASTMIKSDLWIREMSQKGMIEPYAENVKRPGVISSGIGSYGYDMRLHDEYSVFNPAGRSVVDPKEMGPESFTHFKGEVCVIPPNSFVLGRSLEYFRIPRDVLAICYGKSTYARCGVIVNVTPLEPEWEGFVTISISNTTPLPARIHSFEGIAQVLFLGSDQPCDVSYADKSGKYQAQQGITHAKAS